MIKQTVTCLVVLSLSGCAAIQIPADHLERVSASIKGAEEVGALGVPDARLHVQLAKEQVETAKKLADKGDERALLYMARAESDANLALGMAHEATIHSDALKAAEDLKALKSPSAP